MRLWHEHKLRPISPVGCVDDVQFSLSLESWKFFVDECGTCSTCFNALGMIQAMQRRFQPVLMRHLEGL